MKILGYCKKYGFDVTIAKCNNSCKEIHKTGLGECHYLEPREEQKENIDFGYCEFFKCETTKRNCMEICDNPVPIRENNQLFCHFLRPCEEQKENQYIKNPVLPPNNSLYPQQGKKFDNDKLQFNLIPPECIEELAKVLTYGARKYSPDNWKNVEQFDNRYYSALMRHLEAWRKGEENDTESNLNHLSHVLANAAFLLWKNLNEKNKNA